MPGFSSNLRRCACGLFPVLLAHTVSAQCVNPWISGGEVPGTNGEVMCSTMWDPDGAGPAPARLVVAGTFKAVANVPASFVAQFDPTTNTWSPLGAGLSAPDTSNVGVFELETLPNGTLWATGTFYAPGTFTISGSVVWNGVSWTNFAAPVPGVLTGTATSLEVAPNGDVVVADFLGPANAQITRKPWVGGSWTTLGTGMNDLVEAVAWLPNGDVVAGGRFTTAGGAAASRIARWNGSSWAPLGTGMNGAVTALTVMPNGDIVAAGDFSTAGGVPAGRVARWNGTTWSAINVVLGSTNPGGPLVRTVAAQPNGDLVLGGVFQQINGITATNIARWDGTTWSAFAVGWDPLDAASGTGYPRAFASLPDGSTIVGGAFSHAAGVAAAKIARFDGSTWTPLGSGVSGSNVDALVATPTGDVVAGGTFSAAGGIAAANIARWDGTSWSPLGTGLNGPVRALAMLPNGDLIAGGHFTAAGGVPANFVARWDGTSWSPLGAGTNAFVMALAVLPNGDLVAGGTFTSPGTVLARWSGAAWSSFPAGGPSTVPSDGVVRLAVAPNGDLIVGHNQGSFSSGFTALLHRWNGIAWTSVPTSGGLSERLTAVASLPDGDLLVGYTGLGPVFAQQTTALFRRSGATWSAVPSLATVSSLGFAANGDVLVGGTFTFAGNIVSRAFARLTTTCPATVITNGSGCPSSGGNNTLAAVTLPWVDSTLATRATGLPSQALAVAVTSLVPIAQGVAPLSLAFPQAGLGCDLLVQPDILSLHVAANGTATSLLFLPNVPPLVGVTFHHQMICIETDAVGACVAITATNALQLTAGLF